MESKKEKMSLQLYPDGKLGWEKIIFNGKIEVDGNQDIYKISIATRFVGAWLPEKNMLVLDVKDEKQLEITNVKDFEVIRMDEHHILVWEDEDNNYHMEVLRRYL